MNMFCEKCGSDLGNSPEVKFCPQCGEVIVKPEPKDATELCESTEKSLLTVRKKNTFRKIILGFSVLLIIVVGLVWWHDNEAYRILKKMDNIVMLDSKYEVLKVYQKEKFIIVTKGRGKNGVITFDKKELIPCKYDDILVDQTMERIIASNITQVDENGTPVKREEGRPAGRLETTMAAEVDTDSTYRHSSLIMDFSGNVLKELKEVKSDYYLFNYHGSYYFYTELEVIVCDTGTGQGSLLDKNGNYILEDVEEFWSIQTAEGIAGWRYSKWGEHGDKWGLIDENGVEIIPCKYDAISDFHNGLAVVTKNNLKGAINLQGEEVFPCEYENIDAFESNWTRARQDGYLYILDTTGVKQGVGAIGSWNRFWGCEGDDFVIIGKGEDENEEEAVMTRENYMNGELETICEGKDILWNSGMFIVSNADGFYGLFAENGAEILPQEFDSYLEPKGENDYFIFTKNLTDETGVHTVVTLSGECIGEYEGEISYSAESFHIIESVDDMTITANVLGNDGRLLTQWNCLEFKVENDLYYIKVQEDKYMVGNLMDLNSLLETNKRPYIRQDGCIVSADGKWNVYEYSRGSLKKIFSIDDSFYVNSVHGSEINVLRITNSIQWMPFLFSRDNYSVAVVE